MDAAEFNRQRLRIHRCPGRSPAWRAAAMKQLVRSARAEAVMIGSKVIKWVLPCGAEICFKQRFKNQQQADQYIERIRSGIDSRDKHPCRSYYCHTCHGFHLTAQDHRHS